ncbi:MAG: GIY-YIG nuclease family protein [Melioribacteraceae bacterium]|nr:GIY-YIG nuclease family protein [Melioribacteraceae bacterium]
MGKLYWVYILKCSDNSYYTGSTSNLERRIDEHKNKKFTSYTSTRLPIKLMFSQEFHTPQEAIESERKIKHWTRKKKEALIKGDFEELKLYSKKINWNK